MIRGYQPLPRVEPVEHGRFQWGPAFGAGLIAGFVLLVVPRGSPWAAVTAFSPAIMGRVVSPAAGLSFPVVWGVHLAVAVFYGLIISRIIAHLRGATAILVGGAIGLGLYGLNWAVVAALWPNWPGSEVRVVFTHIVFGLIAAGAYRGLLKRRQVAEHN